MLQTALFDCVSLDPFTFEQNRLATPIVDVGRCEIAEALVISMVIVVLHEATDADFQIAGQEVVFQQDAVLERLMPAFDPRLRGDMPCPGFADGMVHHERDPCPQPEASQRTCQTRNWRHCRTAGAACAGRRPVCSPKLPGRAPACR